MGCSYSLIDELEKYKCYIQYESKDLKSPKYTHLRCVICNELLHELKFQLSDNNYKEYKNYTSLFKIKANLHYEKHLTPGKISY